MKHAWPVRERGERGELQKRSLKIGDVGEGVCSDL